MKTVVKIDPKKEYDSAKDALSSIALKQGIDTEISSLSSSIDNMQTVINVLMERLTPSPKKKTPAKPKSKKPPSKPRGEFDRLPSEKFPELTVEEAIIHACELPQCSCCNETMKASGLFKISEKLEVIPKQFYISRQKRVIYNCSDCHGSMRNAPSLPSISRTSNYGDSFILDVALSKYCDLIPIERYSAMAARSGVEGLPANSLIGLTHLLADFLKSLYKMLQKEVLESEVILADETPHKMLEGDERTNWFLWGFSCKTACFFEAHNTRSGEVPLKILTGSNVKYLLTDGYAGYKKALNDLEKFHDMKVEEAYCNAHAFRYFRDASTNWPEETKDILNLYGDIYDIEAQAIEPDDKDLARKKMQKQFSRIKELSEKALPNIVAKSSHEKAVKYFLGHYEGLTRCLKDSRIPLDNNFSERLLRSPVIGRKTWYGTHSKKGARTNACLFSIVETCKINKVNPREYFKWVVEQYHNKSQILTPSQYAIYHDSG